MMVHAALVFPPFCDPRAPQLALPSLAAFLREHGLAVSLHDLNLSGIADILLPGRLRDVRARLARCAANDPSPQLARQIAVCDRLIAFGEEPARALRGARFFEPLAYADGRRTLDETLRLAAIGLCDVGLNPIRYDIAGIDPASLADLLRATAPDRPQVFAGAFEALLAQFAQEPPNLVGITITNRQQLLPGLAFARRARQAGHFVVLGGALISKFADQLRALPEFFETFADVVVVYEGETALLGLAHAVADGRSFADIPNLLYRAGDRVIATTTHVEDVALLPTPDFSGLPLGEYHAPAPVLPILTGKGCYFNRCKFCDIPYINHISRKPYRVRPIERIVADVHTLHARHGASAFVITDEALSPRLLCDLADGFAARPGDFTFTGYARPEPGFTPEACARIAGMGMHKLFFGLESGSQQVLDAMNKGIKLAQVPAVLRNCREAGIDFHLFGIVGLPQERAEQAAETPAFMIANADAIDRPGSSFDLHPFGLELRTRYFEEREAHGVIVDDAALDRPFLIGLAGGEWTNRDGLSPGEVERLISHDFLPALRSRFATWHAGPDPLWPPQEEYSVLYRRHYRGRPFGWRTGIPEDRVRFRFARSGLFGAVPELGLLRFDALNYSITLPAWLGEMISSGAVRCWSEHLACRPDAPAEDEARMGVEALIELGLVALCAEGTAA